MSSIPHRPDIDGLRALAVVSVIVYHLTPGVLAGGNLGVDLFFVLSGYLITALIRSDWAAGRFTLTDFYERRVRRILPALLAVLAATSLVAVVLLLPKDLVGYGRSLLAALGFVANIHFWWVIDYFAPISGEKPLLHTWSLGVEEQFYLLFPLLMMGLLRLRAVTAMAVLAAIVVVSLGLNLVLKVVGTGTFSFYMLPSRAWELAIGALIAFVPTRGSMPRPVVWAASAIGLWAIGLGLVEGKVAVLPAALPVVVGTALVVWAEGRAPSPLGRLLSLPPITFLGRISYSLYLWHWPILVLLRYRLVRPPTPLELALAVVAMLICAVLSWRFVETPFRRRDRPFRPIAWILGTTTVALAGLALAIGLGEGWPRRVSPEVVVINDALGTHARCAGWDGERFAGGRACHLGAPATEVATAQAVLFGNSHAQMYRPLVDDALRRDGRSGVLVGMTECLPTPSINIDVKCARLASETFAAIEALPKVRTVILGLTWDQAGAAFVDEAGDRDRGPWRQVLTRGLDDLIDRIERSGRTAVLIGPIPHPSWDVASVVGRNLAFGRPQDPAPYQTRAAFDETFGPLIAHFQARLGPRFVRADRVFCGAERCDFLAGGRSLYSDGNHIAAAELPRFMPLFREALTAAGE